MGTKRTLQWGLSGLSVTAALAFSGCIRTLENADGLELFVGLGIAPEMTYALAEGSPSWLAVPVSLAVEHWAKSLGDAQLTFVEDPAHANVVVEFESVATLEAQPAHTELWGCRNGGGSACRIVVRMPLASEALLDARAGVVFERGVFDELLTDRKRYLETGDYLRDKLALLIVAHEIGHTLGLGHSADPACLMAAVPGGGGAFCAAEVKAARGQLASARREAED